ncbi:ATP-binding cassette domain-containing protein [Bradyrhizobium sp.]|uniref:ATP-binding cassette domain-containing protein n=1 Tax=Bradyrhizobium sp. TaxID=376 RepID=UPI0039E46DBD
MSARHAIQDSASALPRNAITVEHLWKAFHDDRRHATVIAISDVTITVPRGQFICICGPSGCGKSTLVRILAGLEEETLGSIGIERDAGVARPPAMVFQEASLFPWLTVEDNVKFPLRLQGASPEEQEKRARELLALMRLEDFGKAFPHQLSGGMKQRASVARALIDRDSNILLMDEPFGALDEQTRMELQQELLRVWERTGKTVVFITHSVEEALTLGDRIIVMSARPGEIAADIEVPFARPRDVLELRRHPDFGRMTFDIWKLLARYKGDEASERPDAVVDATPPKPEAAAQQPSAETLERLARPSRNRKIISLLGKFSPLSVLLLWEIVVKSGIADDRFFPAPSSILSIFWNELAHGPLLVDAYATLERVLIGFAIGGIPAIALGLALGMWPTARELIAPIFSALYPVPKIATFPLLLMIFGLGEAPKYAVIAIVVFFLVFFNTMSGTRYAPKIYFDVGHNLGMSRFGLFRFIALPAALPSIFTGLKLAIGTAFVVIAAVEFVGAKTGLGYAIWSSWQIFAVEKMYVNIIAISVSGYLSIIALDGIERLVMPWSRN